MRDKNMYNTLKTSILPIYTKLMAFALLHGCAEAYRRAKRIKANGGDGCGVNGQIKQPLRKTLWQTQNQVQETNRRVAAQNRPLQLKQPWV